MSVIERSVKPSMLLRFEAANVRSFLERFEINFESTTLSESRFVREVPWRERGAPVGVLPVVCVFGPNASGKSNVLKSMSEMRSIVVNSFSQWAPTKGTRRNPFQLSRGAAELPTSFAVDLILDGVRHEYGFELDDARILREWACRYPKGRAAVLFVREHDEVSLGASLGAKGRAAVGLLRSNALFLSTAAAAGQPELTRIFDWFSRNFLLAEAESRHLRHLYVAEMLEDDGSNVTQIRALLRAADLGISDVRRREVPPAIRERVQRAVRVLTEGAEEAEESVFAALDGLTLEHHGADGEYELDANDESLGTMVWLGLIAPVVSCLEHGSVLLADELDASLHPSLVAQLVRLFQDPETNPNRAQLVFNSHEMVLLGDSGAPRSLGRDQIWFTEKSTNGSSRIFPLSDLDPRKDEAISRRYLAGRYGAVPIVADADFDAVAELITSSS